MKRTALILFLVISVCLAATAQGGNAAPAGWTLLASPSYTLPLTAGDFSSNEAFAGAWGGSLGLEYGSATLPLGLRVEAGYTAGGLLPVDGVAVSGTLTEASLLAGAAVRLPLGSALSVYGLAEGGAAYGFLSDGTRAPYGVFRAGAGLGMDIGKYVIARLEAAWTHKLGVYGGLNAGLSMGWRLPAGSPASAPAPKVRLLQISVLDIKDVFPILRSWYGDHPLGKVRITNTGKETARDVKVSFIIRQYMDAAKECAVITALEPGASTDVDVFGLFNDGILAVTEATRASAEVSVEYGTDGAESRAATVTVYDRTALTWADDRLAAAFVSSKDPWVLDLCGNITAAVKDSRNPGLVPNVQTAIAFHEGLRAFGLGYVLSPNRPFAQTVVNTETVDSLKFPRQTLGFRSGDCADLSVLYASCFEAVGIETAFITVPGHIFMAIDLGITAAEAKARAMDERELIVKGDRTWLPIETTMRDAGFLDAWKKAAQEWREASAQGTSAFYPVHDAWKLYAPVGLPADGSTVAAPSADAVKRVFSAELARAVDAELTARLAALGGASARGQASAKDMNSMGVLYARYGRYADAERCFQAGAKQGHTPSMINLGNVAYVTDDMTGALGWYQKAATADPENAKLLINMARAAAALGKTDVVEKTLAAVRKIDPAAADRYAGLGAGGAMNAAGGPGTRAAAQEEEGPAWF